MAELKPNSHRYREALTEKKEPKKVTKVISGKVQRKKKSEVRKILDAFIPENMDDFKNHVFFDLFIPKIKQLGEDMFHAFLYGETNSSRRYDSSHVSYSSYSKNRGSTYRDTIGRDKSRRSFYNYDELIFDSREKAKTVLESMRNHLEEYDIVTVGDYYDYAGETTSNTDYSYGWKSIRTAEVIRVHNGYSIELPKALLLD